MKKEIIFSIFISIIIFLSLITVINANAIDLRMTDQFHFDYPIEATGFVNHASATLGLLDVLNSAGVLPAQLVNATEAVITPLVISAEVRTQVANVTGTILIPTLVVSSANVQTLSVTDIALIASEIVQKASFQYLSATGGIQTDGSVEAGSFIGTRVTSGENPGHTHTGSSLSGIDISDDTNLAGGTNLTLSDDTINVDDPFYLGGTIRTNSNGGALYIVGANTDYRGAALELHGADELNSGDVYFYYGNYNGVAATTAAFYLGYLNNGGIYPSIYCDNNSNTGLGTTSPQNKLDVEGAAAIGASYSGTYTAPANGLIVQGGIACGTTELTNTVSILSQNPAEPYTGLNVYSGDETAYTGIGIGRTMDHVDGLFTVAGGNGHYLGTNGQGDIHLLMGNNDYTDMHFGKVGQDTYFILTNAGLLGIATTTPSVPLEINGVVKCKSVVQYCNDAEKRSITTIESATQEELRDIVRNIIPKKYIKEVPSEFKNEKTIDDFKDQVKIVNDMKIIDVSTTARIPEMETVYEIVNKTDYNPDGTISFGTETVAKEIQKMVTESYQERKTYIIRDASGIIQSATWGMVDKERSVPVYTEEIQWSTKEIVSGTHEEIIKTATDQLAEWNVKREEKINHKNYNQERYGIVLNQSNVPDFLRVWSDDGNVGYFGIGETAMFLLDMVHDQQLQIDALEGRIAKLKAAIKP